MFTRPERGDIDLKSDTQRRIVEVAGGIFADSGYEHTTIRAISERASVNVAAINYHFGGKKNLYLSVFKYWRARVFEKYPLDIEDLSFRPPEERLRAFIRTLLRRCLDEGEGSCFAKLMAREFVQPTAGFDMIMDETLGAYFGFLSGTVRGFFPVAPPDMTVNLCCFSIVGQVFHLYMGRNVFRRFLDRERLTPGEIEMVADHIVTFSLNAIRRIAAGCQGEQT
jgi:TetR/AcrR family transcriptional regulator, regulator of cefoperazone and chloramphenicol sensitivity